MGKYLNECPECGRLVWSVGSYANQIYMLRHHKRVDTGKPCTPRTIPFPSSTTPEIISALEANKHVHEFWETVKSF